jgi:hypothetical protein
MTDDLPASASDAGSAAVDPQRAWLLAQPSWDDALLATAGIPIADAHLVTVGGGLGSFAVVDFLRVAGLAASQIRVLSNLAAPYDTFAALARASQLGPDDRLRSDSSSMVHGIWGWPGYALWEAWAERSLAPLWRVVTEPILSEYFTPRVRTVISGVAREAERIGWGEMLVRGWVDVVRRRRGGGYLVLVRRPAGQGAVAYRCQHVHIALGHPGPRLLPDVVAFRARYCAARNVVAGYEPHEHVYEQLVRAPGRVVVRGAGITASRILERLIHDRDARGAQTEILHLFRHYTRGPVGPPWFRRPGGNGFAYQPFNFPRAAGGGQLRQRMLAMSGEERARLLARIGGTTTAWRRRWQRQLARGRRERWYHAETGELSELGLDRAGKLRCVLSQCGAAPRQLDIDFLIDVTGLEAAIERHALIADLIEQGGASFNALGRLEVEPSFELRAMRSGAGRMYASGAATLGGALAPVDSFWGLMHAAMEITDDLADQGTCEFPGVMRSMIQWWRWMRNKPP